MCTDTHTHTHTFKRLNRSHVLSVLHNTCYSVVYHAGKKKLLKSGSLSLSLPLNGYVTLSLIHHSCVYARRRSTLQVNTDYQDIRCSRELIVRNSSSLWLCKVFRLGMSVSAHSCILRVGVCIFEQITWLVKRGMNGQAGGIDPRWLTEWILRDVPKTEGWLRGCRDTCDMIYILKLCVHSSTSKPISSTDLIHNECEVYKCWQWWYMCSAALLEIKCQLNNVKM